MWYFLNTSGSFFFVKVVYNSQMLSLFWKKKHVILLYLHNKGLMFSRRIHSHALFPIDCTYLMVLYKAQVVVQLRTV